MQVQVRALLVAHAWARVFYYYLFYESLICFIYCYYSYHYYQYHQQWQKCNHLFSSWLLQVLSLSVRFTINRIAKLIALQLLNLFCFDNIFNIVDMTVITIIYLTNTIITTHTILNWHPIWSNLTLTYPPPQVPQQQQGRTVSRPCSAGEGREELPDGDAAPAGEQRGSLWHKAVRGG